MNRQNTRTLIERLKTCEHRQKTDTPRDKASFSLMIPAFPCGSPACVAGHCADLLGADPRTEGTKRTIQEFLDAGKEATTYLFFGLFSTSRRVEDITPQDVIKYLEELMKNEHE